MGSQPLYYYLYSVQQLQIFWQVKLVRIAVKIHQITDESVVMSLHRRDNNIFLLNYKVIWHSAGI